MKRIKEEYILYKGNPFETLNLIVTYVQNRIQSDSTSGTIVLGRLIGSSLVESFTNSYTLTDPNGTEEKYT